MSRMNEIKAAVGKDDTLTARPDSAETLKEFSGREYRRMVELMAWHTLSFVAGIMRHTLRGIARTPSLLAVITKKCPPEQEDT
jgi:hypothetical protein